MPVLRFLGRVLGTLMKRSLRLAAFTTVAAALMVVLDLLFLRDAKPPER